MTTSITKTKSNMEKISLIIRELQKNNINVNKYYFNLILDYSDIIAERINMDNYNIIYPIRNKDDNIINISSLIKIVIDSKIIYHKDKIISTEHLAHYNYGVLKDIYKKDICERIENIRISKVSFDNILKQTMSNIDINSSTKEYIYNSFIENLGDNINFLFDPEEVNTISNKIEVVISNLINEEKLIEAEVIEEGVVEESEVEEGVVEESEVEEGVVEESEVEGEVVEEGEVIEEDTVDEGEVIEEDTVDEGEVIEEDTVDEGVAVEEEQSTFSVSMDTLLTPAIITETESLSVKFNRRFNTIISSLNRTNIKYNITPIANNIFNVYLENGVNFIIDLGSIINTKIKVILNTDNINKLSSATIVNIADEETNIISKISKLVKSDFGYSPKQSIDRTVIELDKFFDLYTVFSTLKIKDSNKIIDELNKIKKDIIDFSINTGFDSNRWGVYDIDVDNLSFTLVSDRALHNVNSTVYYDKITKICYTNNILHDVSGDIIKNY